MIRARKSFLILCLGLAIIALPLTTLQAQTAGDSQPHQTTAPEFWNAAIQMVEPVSLGKLRQSLTVPRELLFPKGINPNQLMKWNWDERKRRNIGTSHSDRKLQRQKQKLMEQQQGEQQ